MKRLEDIDVNFRLSTDIPEDTAFYSAYDAPFEISGVAGNDPGVLCRLPVSFLPECNEGVQHLAWHLAGAVVRFSTDSSYIAIAHKLTTKAVMPHFTACGQSGMELFEETNAGSRHVKNFIPKLDNGCGTLLEQSAFAPLPGGMRHYALYLPLYNGVTDLSIGFAPDAQVLPGRQPAINKPLVFYGSSITQGGCAAKCGSCYTSIVARRLDARQINLGFSGSGRGEKNMAEYIASLDMSVFVMDYDHNAWDPPHLEKTHEVFFKTIRAAHPDMPILIISRPDYDRDPKLAEACFAIIKRTYDNAVASGDAHVRLINGRTLFDETDRELCTVDGSHPNDLGFLRMADHVTAALKDMMER